MSCGCCRRIARVQGAYVWHTCRCNNGTMRRCFACGRCCDCCACSAPMLLPARHVPPPHGGGDGVYCPVTVRGTVAAARRALLLV